MADKPFYSNLEHSRREGQIRAYIMNAARLAGGEQVGAWHPFPCTAEEMRATLREIGADGQDAEITITDYDSQTPGLIECLPPDADLNELNYLAAKLDRLGALRLETYMAALEAGEHTSSLWHLINLTENLDCYTLNPAAFNERSLGLLSFENEQDSIVGVLGGAEASAFGGIEDVLKYIGMLEAHFDAEHYGAALHRDGDGVFTENGYLEKTARPFEAVYLGNEHIPDEYRVYNPDIQTGQQNHTAYHTPVPSSRPVRVADTDLTTLVFKLHELAGEYMRDVEHNLRKLAEPGGQYFVMLQDPACISITDAKLLYSDRKVLEGLESIHAEPHELLT